MDKTTLSGKHIFDGLVERGLTLRQLADASGIPHHTLQQVVLGTTPLDDLTANKIEVGMASFDRTKD